MPVRLFCLRPVHHAQSNHCHVHLGSLMHAHCRTMALGVNICSQALCSTSSHQLCALLPLQLQNLAYFALPPLVFLTVFINVGAVGVADVRPSAKGASGGPLVMNIRHLVGARTAV